jgi:AraC family transcriptional regulator
MSDAAVYLDLARAWGADSDDIVVGLTGKRISAAHWRHNVPEFADTPAPANFVAMLLKPSSAERFTGARRFLPGMGTGSMLTCPAGLDGRWIFHTEVETLHVYLPQPLLDQFSGSGRAVELHDDLDLDDPIVQRLMLEILKAMHGDHADRVYSDTLGIALAARLAEHHACGGMPARIMRGGLAGWQLKRVTEYIDAHLAEDVALAELAAIADLSPYHFCRAFKQSMGLPPHAWLITRRIERAKALMAAHPKMGLTDVALGVGYQSQTALGNAFKRATGTTPGQWRRGRAG